MGGSKFLGSNASKIRVTDEIDVGSEVSDGLLDGCTDSLPCRVIGEICAQRQGVFGIRQVFHGSRLQMARAKSPNEMSAKVRKRKRRKFRLIRTLDLR